jgi:hypothetical protein
MSGRCRLTWTLHQYSRREFEIPIAKVTSIRKRQAVEELCVRSWAGWRYCQTNALGIKAFVTFFIVTRYWYADRSVGWAGWAFVLSYMKKLSWNLWVGKANDKTLLTKDNKGWNMWQTMKKCCVTFDAVNGNAYHCARKYNSLGPTVYIFGSLKLNFYYYIRIWGTKCSYINL